MFSEISESMKMRMKFLEEMNAKNERDGIELLKRLRQIPPETGKFIALLAANCPNNGEFIEIGTSAGYSSMWLSLAMKLKKRRLKTFKILPEKVALAKETIRQTQIGDEIELIEGDFLKIYNGL